MRLNVSVNFLQPRSPPTPRAAAAVTIYALNAAIAELDGAKSGGFGLKYPGFKVSHPDPRFAPMLSRLGLDHLRRALPIWLWSIVAVLVAAHIVAMIIHFRVVELPCHVREVFDLEENESFAGLFTSLILIFAGLTVLYHARQLPEEGRGMRVLWRLLGIGFCLLAIEKFIGLHRKFGFLIGIPRTVLAVGAAVLVGLAYIPFLARLPAATRNLFVVAGAIYLAGAIGFDFATGWFPVITARDWCGDQIVTLGYRLTAAVETGLEMSGVVLFIQAMLKLED